MAADPERAELPRSRRVRKRSEFTRIQDAGVRVTAGPMLLLLGKRAEGGAARLGIVASKKVGNAVERNRAKRLIREAFRRHSAALPEGLDLVVVARSGMHALGLADVERALVAALPSVARRAAALGRNKDIPRAR